MGLPCLDWISTTVAAAGSSRLWETFSAIHVLRFSLKSGSWPQPWNLSKIFSFLFSFSFFWSLEMFLKFFSSKITIVTKAWQESSLMFFDFHFAQQRAEWWHWLELTLTRPYFYSSNYYLQAVCFMPLYASNMNNQYLFNEPWL